MSLLDTFLSDTVGVAYRATTGNVDPWTKQDLIDQATADQIKAGADPATAAAVAEQTVTDTLKTFSLGGDDPTGADPSQARVSLPSWESVKTAGRSLTNDDGSGCGLTNLGGCVPSWVPWAVGGVLVLGALWLIRPYVGLAAAVRS